MIFSFFFSFNKYKSEKYWYTPGLADLVSNHTKFQPNEIRINTFSQNCMTLLWPWKWSRSVKVVITHEHSTIMQSLTLITFIMYEKIGLLKLLTPMDAQAWKFVIIMHSVDKSQLTLHKRSNDKYALNKRFWINIETTWKYLCILWENICSSGYVVFCL